MEFSECFGYISAAARQEEIGNVESANLLYRKAAACFRNYFAAYKEDRRPHVDLIDEKMTDELRARVYEDPSVAIEVSKGLEMGFQNAGIKFDKGKTFAAVLYAIEQPEHLSQVVYVDNKAKTSIAYLTNHQTMEFANERVQRDRLNIHI